MKRFAFVLLGSLAALPARADDDAASNARAVLQAHCVRCHNRDGNAKGGLDYILERDLLAARNKLVPGKAADSELFVRVKDGEMPPRSVKNRPTADELAVLQKWIDAGAADWQPARPAQFLTESDVLQAMAADLRHLPATQRRFARYFTLTNLVNAGRSDEEIQTHRLALDKLVNSLSFHPRLTSPVAIDRTHTVFRIDLRDYKWNARTWERIAAVYPYRTGNNGADARECAHHTDTEVPYVRADWFVATVSRAPLYYDTLQIPTSDRTLERQLQVDVQQDIEQLSVVRSGFNGSGVSKNNRLIERHDAGHGAYWKTYDFSENTERQNLFDHPLGPPPASSSFVHAGGEIIFHLPNGLLGYMLADRTGRRVDRAPIEIVSDPKRPDRAVEAGLSCMTCHAAGFIPKADQVRAHVLKNAQAFGRDDVEIIKAIYAPELKLRTMIEQDNKRYLEALAKTGVQPKAEDVEPITAVTLRYEAVVDLAGAAGEAGLKAVEFADRLGKSPELGRALGALRTKGGTIQREALIVAFPNLVKEFRLGESPATESVAGPGRGFSGHSGTILAVALSVDGKRALSGSEDRTVRLWDAATGKEIRKLEGHTGAVGAVAFSAGGKWAITGGDDRTLRRWDLETGKETLRLTGHTDKITSIALSPDGKRAASGGQDNSVRVWDTESGKELLTLTGHQGRVGSVVFSLDGKKILSASHDGTIRLWDAKSGEELRTLRGTLGEVYSAALSPDGQLVAGGGGDRMVRMWTVEGGQELRRLEGHANAVIRVAFSADGKYILSGSSQYQQPDKVLRKWRTSDGKAISSQGGSESDRIGLMVFSADGKSALSDGPVQSLRLWQVDP